METNTEQSEVATPQVDVVYFTQPTPEGPAVLNKISPPRISNTDLEYVDRILPNWVELPVERINGSLVVTGSSLLCFSNLSYVSQDVRLIRSTVDLPSLAEVQGHFLIDCSEHRKDSAKATHFQSIKKVGALTIRNSILTDLGTLEEVVGNADLTESKVTSSGALRRVGGNFSTPPKFKDMPSLEEVGGNLLFHLYDGRFTYDENKIIESLGKVRRVGGDLSLLGTMIQDLSGLDYLGGKLHLSMGLTYILPRSIKPNQLVPYAFSSKENNKGRGYIYSYKRTELEQPSKTK